MACPVLHPATPIPESTPESLMRREFFVGLLLVVAVAFVYWPVHSYPFILLDDQAYVSQNPLVRKGLTREGVVYAFSGATVSNWHPLTMLSHMLDSQLFGVKDADAGKHHLVNLFLHAANTFLLFVALRQMTGAVWRSGFAAALFGLHPLHVESVAWIAERKTSSAPSSSCSCCWPITTTPGGRRCCAT